MHKFKMDAEKDENNILEFDKDRIGQKLTEIINLVTNYNKEMHAYNKSEDMIKFPALTNNKLNDTIIYDT